MRWGEDNGTVPYIDVVNGCGLGRRELERLTGQERELATVLPALQEPTVLVDVTLGERHALVGAPVADGVDVVANSDDCDFKAVNVEAACFAGGQLVESAKMDRQPGHWTVRVATTRW